MQVCTRGAIDPKMVKKLGLETHDHMARVHETVLAENLSP